MWVLAAANHAMKSQLPCPSLSSPSLSHSVPSPQGNWGVVDVDDCCAAARYLAERGLVDPARLCIDGGSAGGYTTLACLAFRYDEGRARAQPASG